MREKWCKASESILLYGHYPLSPLPFAANWEQSVSWRRIQHRLPGSGWIEQDRDRHQHGSGGHHHSRGAGAQPAERRPRHSRNKLVVMSGVSGSGKSSLAFDTVYAEGQRRYVESLSTYAPAVPRPDAQARGRLDHGLAPSISIQQKATSRNPRSTVGTITEIYDYLRVLYARVGQGCCTKCQKPITAQSLDQILESVLTLPEGTRFQILAPLVQNQKGEFRDLFQDLLKKRVPAGQGRRRGRVALVRSPAQEALQAHHRCGHRPPGGRQGNPHTTG